MRKLRISAISFLNTAPLMWDFDYGVPPTDGSDRRVPADLARDFEVEYTIPSQCAEALRAGVADIGIIPAVTFATIPDLVIIPDVAIAAKNAVRSILLISKVPLKRVHTLAADTSSRTSVALTRVLFHHWFGRVPEFVPTAPRLESMLENCDAALLIGDPALQVDRLKYRTWDLGSEWRRLTGKPFVFAFWAVRLAALNEMRSELDLAGIFRDSRDRGLRPESLRVIGREWASRVGLSETEVRDYLTQNIHYSLDDENISGMELFFRYAAECSAIPHAPALRFLSGARCAMSSI